MIIIISLELVLYFSSFWIKCLVICQPLIYSWSKKHCLCKFKIEISLVSLALSLLSTTLSLPLSPLPPLSLSLSLSLLFLSLPLFLALSISIYTNSILYIYYIIYSRHENVSGYYRVSAYFIAKVLCDMLITRLFPLCFFTVIAYFMIGKYLYEHHYT